MVLTAILFALFIVIVTIWVLTIRGKRIRTIDGSPVEEIVPTARGKTIFGNTFDMISMSSEELFYFSRELAKNLKKSYVEYILGSAIYNIIDAADAELIFNEQNLTTKGIIYQFLHPFLKTGLLTSAGKKWHARRRLLTPAFHFNILAQFEEIFKQESQKFVQNLIDKHSDHSENIISLSNLIPRFTLNSICETALGVRLDERLDGDEYRENIKKIEETLVKRVKNPFLTLQFIYNLFSDGKSDEIYLKQLHGFSSGIIEKRRILFKELLQNADETKQAEIAEFNSIYRKQRYAMLDALLQAEKDGLIDHKGICEEVDTFMFEGFDTTSMGLIFSLMNLSLYPEIQQRCFDEINEFIDDDLEHLDITQLNKLKYLECFIKETQRLYPSVPLIVRNCVTDTQLNNNLILPKGTQVIIHIFDIHRNEKYYDNPDEFRPERFLIENCEKRHPFSFIPFSAGQRNCIGQKFALLEVKTLLVYMLKNFKLSAAIDPAHFKFLSGLLLRSRSDIKIKIASRLSNK